MRAIGQNRMRGGGGAALKIRHWYMARTIEHFSVTPTMHRRRKRGDGGGTCPPPPKFQVGGIIPPLNFRWAFFFFFACHPGGRCCVPRVPLPNNVNDVRKLSPPPPPPPLISFFGSCASDFILSQAWRARKKRPSPLNLCASAANAIPCLLNTFVI